MSYSKLTQSDFGHGDVSRAFERVQRSHELTDHGRERVNEAMQAAVAHITKKHDLSGMHETHVDEAMRYIHDHYDGRSDLSHTERKVIEQSFKHHFGIEEPSTE